MVLLGTFREEDQDVQLRVKGDKQLDPSSVEMQVRFDGGLTEDLVMVDDGDSDGIPTNEFKNAPPLDLTGKPTGTATVRTLAKDTAGRLGSRLDTIRIISGYGRNYGRDYGNGL